jgi:hypothetical protein
MFATLKAVLLSNTNEDVSNEIYKLYIADMISKILCDIGRYNGRMSIKRILSGISTRHYKVELNNRDYYCIEHSSNTYKRIDYVYYDTAYKIWDKHCHIICREHFNLNIGYIDDWAISNSIIQ